MCTFDPGSFRCQGGEGVNGFTFVTFIGRFPSDGVASVAVKGLSLDLSGFNRWCQRNTVSLALGGGGYFFNSAN